MSNNDCIKLIVDKVGSFVGNQLYIIYIYKKKYFRSSDLRNQTLATAVVKIYITDQEGGEGAVRPRGGVGGERVY